MVLAQANSKYYTRFFLLVNTFFRVRRFFPSSGDPFRKGSPEEAEGALASVAETELFDYMGDRFFHGSRLEGAHQIPDLQQLRIAGSLTVD